MVRLKYFTRVPNVGDRFALDVAERYFDASVNAANQVPLTEPNVVLAGSILQWADEASIGLWGGPSSIRRTVEV